MDVSLQGGWHLGSAVADEDGRFTVHLDPQEAGGPYTVSRADENMVALEGTGVLTAAVSTLRAAVAGAEPPDRGGPRPAGYPVR